MLITEKLIDVLNRIKLRSSFISIELVLTFNSWVVYTDEISMRS